ncbi:hypothetical protein DL93DRAFT_2074599 [Clavulina sp. PMI_390]|nr:hypothetical protein DL93DRAFT_2074599 [Clavulina sp. PMI_390]
MRHQRTDLHANRAILCDRLTNPHEAESKISGGFAEALSPSDSVEVTIVEPFLRYQASAWVPGAPLAWSRLSFNTSWICSRCRLSLAM